MSADPNACYCGGGADGHVVDCPAPFAMSRRTFMGLDLGRSRDKVALRCGCGHVIDLDGDRRLLLAAQMVLEVRPANWADDEDPDQVAAWSALEEAVRGCVTPPPSLSRSWSREALDGVMP